MARAGIARALKGSKVSGRSLRTRVGAFSLGLLATGCATAASVALGFSALNWAANRRLDELGYRALAAGLLLVVAAGLAMAILASPVGRWVRRRVTEPLAFISILALSAAWIFEFLGTSVGLIGAPDVSLVQLLLGLTAAQGPALAVTATFLAWARQARWTPSATAETGPP